MQVNGTVIPEGTIVRSFLTEILKGDLWSDGEKFKPERFLDEAGKVKRDEKFIPFSVGKRQCLGETLAKSELFLFITSLVQQFKFLPEVEGRMPGEEAIFGLSCHPKPFKTKLIKRF